MAAAVGAYPDILRMLNMHFFASLPNVHSVLYGVEYHTCGAIWELHLLRSRPVTCRIRSGGNEAGRRRVGNFGG